MDGSPPAPYNTGAYAFWAHMPSSKSVTWQSNGSDFSKSVHYYCVTWILLKISHEFEASSLILSLWEAVVSDIDRRQLLKKWNVDFWYIFWKFWEVLVANARFSVWFWYRLQSSKVKNLIWAPRIFFSNFNFSNIGMFFEDLRIQFRDIYIFF